MALAKQICNAGRQRSVRFHVAVGVLFILAGAGLGPAGADAQQAASRTPPWQRTPTTQSVRIVGAETATVPTAVPATSTPRAAAPSTTSRSFTRARQASQITYSDADAVVEAAPGEVYYEGDPSIANSITMPGPVTSGCTDCGTPGMGVPGMGIGEAFWGAGDVYDSGAAFVPWWGFAPGRLWVRGESLLWWTEGTRLPPLVTTSPQGTDQEDAGVLPDATILFGDQEVNDGSRSGGRISFGLRPNECSPWGIETSYMRLGSESTSFFAEGQNGRPILARPYFDIEANEAAAALISFQGEENSFQGEVSALAAVTFQGLELLMRRRVSDWCTGSFDFIAGWRYWRLDDDLIIGQDVDRLTTPQANIQVTDRFLTENRFNGGEIGFVTETQWCRWSFGALLKVGIGTTDSRVTIAGTTVVDDVTDNYGLLALPSNIGVYSDDEFAMVPEFGLTVGYDLTCRLRATFGYTLIYWGGVARAADQVSLDLNIPNDNDRQVGLARPEFPFARTDFWAQGLNFGLEYRF